MKKKRVVVALIVLAGLLIAFRLWRGAFAREAMVLLERADTVELISLDPLSLFNLDQPYAGEKLGEWRVLGKTQLNKADARKALNAMTNSVVWNTRLGSSVCFNPRHALRSQVNGRTALLMICFECGVAYGTVEENGMQIYREYFSPGRSAESVFNEFLIDGKIPIAK